MRMANNLIETVKKREVLFIYKIDSWQPKNHIEENLWKNYWLEDMTANFHVCND